MSKKSLSKGSETNKEFLYQASDQEIDLGDIPEITAEQLAGAVLRVGGEPVVPNKIRVNMYLDADLVAYFKAKAGGRGYQTLINETLRQSIQNEGLEHLLRRIIREEIGDYDT